MKNYFFIFVFVFSFMTANAQESSALTKITLKNGTVFVGEVILKNDELIMLQNNAGERFQFALSEIDKTETTAIEPTNPAKTTIGGVAKNDNLCGQFEFSLGNASARKAFDFKSITQVALAFGNRKSFGKDLFVGVGAGYLRIGDVNLSLIPATLKIQTYTSKNRTSPYIGFDSGYAFSTSKNYGGGPFAKISVGINHRLNYKSTIYAGISAAVYSIKSSLTEINLNGVYAFNGTTTINDLALKAGFQF